MTYRDLVFASDNSYWLLVEGSLYKAVNPTPGTGIAQGVIAAFSATAGLLSLKNGNAAGEPNLVPLYLRLIPTVVPASSIRAEGLVAIDSIDRYSSGGSSITTLPNASMPSTRAAGAVVKFGALVLAAESANVRRLSRFQMRAAIPVAFEEYVLDFTRPAPATETLGGTTAVRGVIPVGPALIGPGHTLTVHTWYPSNLTTGASWEFELAWIERRA